jgi:transcriptional regulator with XRE-family HTH domain
MSTAELVRQARRGSGLTQRALAARAGVGQSALADIERSAHDTRGEQLHRLVNAAGYRLTILPTSAGSAADWADFIHQKLRAHSSEETTFRALIGLSDDLSSVAKPLRVALCVTPPAPCGDSRLDAAIAAIVEHHLTKDRLPVPGWVREASRIVDDPWIVSPYSDPADVPNAFRRHGVLLAESELASI